MKKYTKKEYDSAMKVVKGYLSQETKKATEKTKASIKEGYLEGKKKAHKLASSLKDRYKAFRKKK